MTIEIPDDWHEKTANIKLVCRYLKEAQGYESADIVRVLDEPRDWTAEYAAAVVLYQSQEEC